MNTGAGPLPFHLPVLVDPRYTHRHEAHDGTFLDAVWFGCMARPGRAWGCDVLLAGGAHYRDVPLWALAVADESVGLAPDWTPQQAQPWDCYGLQWTAFEYPFLREQVAELLPGPVRGLMGRYVCTIVPLEDGWSRWPEQAKTFHLLACQNGRFTLRPTNELVWLDDSLGRVPRDAQGRVIPPQGLRASDSAYYAEGP